MTTAGSCRYRLTIPVGQGGRLDVDSNFGIRRAFLPQGRRRYVPLQNHTSQQVLIEKASAGPITILMIGSHSNVAYFLMNNPHLKNNIEHIYIMGGGLRHPGNLFTSFASNPCAEYNIFIDPFAAYQVIHSGVPITLVPLDATDTVLVHKEFFEMFEKKQETLEAQYCFKSLKMARDTWPNDQFYSVLHKPDFGNRILGKPVVFDMDMSLGDFLALLYLLKAPVEVTDLKAIIVSPTGWANAATIDVIYDFLHMMGRDDVPVGLGELIAANQSDPMFLPSVGGCKYVKVIPHGSGGFLDSDTLYGLAKDLPKSPRRYTAENSVEFGAPRNIDHPELRQPRAIEVWELVVKSLEVGSKDTFHGEIAGAVLLAGDNSVLKPILQDQSVMLVAEGDESIDGQIMVDEKQGNEQKRMWSMPPE
ncbi:Nucleoside hydrolase 3 [Linum perenne]